MAAAFTYRVKRVKGETVAGRPLWSVVEHKGKRITRRFFGTLAEMKTLAAQHRKATRANPSGTTFEARAKRAIKKGEKFLVSLPARLKRRKK